MVQNEIFLFGAEGVKMHKLFSKLLGITMILFITLMLFYNANYFYLLGVCILLSILFKTIKLKEKINKITLRWENNHYWKRAMKSENIDVNWLNGDGDD